MIANAGGINPLGCADALREVCKAENVDLKVGVVRGDDLMSQVKS